jgi:hypothetical protein
MKRIPFLILTVIFGVRTADRYLALRIEKLDGIPAERGTSLHFEMNGSGRMDTKHADYAHQQLCHIGFGHLPAKTKTSVRVESITALAEIPAQLENPVIRTGIGTLAVHGVVTSGQYLQYQGGDTASVFDENWIKIRDLSVEKRDYTMPAGYAPVSVTAKTKPWLEVQFMTEGVPMIVRP